MLTPPTHLLVGSSRHGVTRHAGEVAAALRASRLSVADAASLDDLHPPGPLHVHVTDRLLGPSPAAAADRLLRLAARAPTTVTLHDLPQPSDGTAFPARRTAYRRILAAARAWAVSSWWEHALVRAHLDPAARGAVVPLPVLPRPRLAPESTGLPTLGVLGWVYPGKGHEPVIDAAAELVDAGVRVRVLALGGVASGHRDLAQALAHRARHQGVPWTLTGWLSEAGLTRHLADTTVGVVAHTHVSASGSTTAWVGAGRRPLVVDSPYARETSDLRPGCYALYSPADLAAELKDAVADPDRTRLPTAPVPWGLSEAAAAYCAWWLSLS